MRTERLVFLTAALIAGLVYAFTSAPGLGLVDSGELTTVASTLSISHPTGYPLYTLLGHIWLMLLPLDPARLMVLFSVVCAALAVGVLAVVACNLLTRLAAVPRAMAAAAAIVFSAAFAFSRSVWTSVSFAEVYPLTLLIACILLWIFVQLYLDENNSHPALIPLAVYLWGLGFGNHFTILWFFPIVLWLAARYVLRSEARLRATVWLCALFAAGASVNLFLPVRSATGPLLDWSDPQTLSNLLRHLTAWQYRVWMFEGGLGDFLGGLFNYLGSVPRDFGLMLTIFGMIGLVHVVAKRQWALLTLLAAWLIGVAYNLNYSIPDIATYFVAFYAPLFVFSCFGIVTLVKLLAKQAPSLRSSLALSVGVLSAALGFASVLPDANHHRDTFATDHARAVLATLPEHSIVFQANWDIQSPVLYLQNVAGERPDAAMFDLALLQRPWYLQQEQRRHPEIFSGCEDKIMTFTDAVTPFERVDQYDGQLLETSYVDMVNCLIEHSYHERPVYVRDTRSVGHPGVAAKFPTYPGGYFFRVAGTPLPEPMLNPDAFLHDKTSFDEREQYLLRQAAVTAALRGSFSLDSGDTTTARKCLTIATKLAPQDQIVTRFAAQMNSISTGSP